VVQLVLSCLVPIAVGLLGAAAFGRRTGYLAVAFASLYFPFIEFGALFLSEIHFIFWLALAFAGFLGALQARRRGTSIGLSLAAGFALSLAISMKNVGLLAAVGFFAVDGLARLLARAPRSGGAPAWLACLRPWVLRVAMVAVGAAPVMGTMARICTRANRGHFCFAGNKPAADFLLGHYGRIAGITWAEDQGHGYFFGSPGSILRHYDARATVPYVINDNASNAAEAWRWIAAHPGEAIVLSLDHVYDTFLGTAMWPSFGHASWPYAHLFQYVFVVLLFLPTLYACVLVGRRGVRAFLTSRTALVLAPVAVLTVTVMIATGEVRYRIPFDIFFIAVAVALATGELRRESIEGRRSPTPTAR
jgi:4-amino-4-deoxy-L-arabinose transferase-like glycosyltransferase